MVADHQGRKHKARLKAEPVERRSVQIVAWLGFAPKPDIGEEEINPVEAHAAPSRSGRTQCFPGVAIARDRVTQT
jgi:hypothetical protein